MVAVGRSRAAGGRSCPPAPCRPLVECLLLLLCLLPCLAAAQVVTVRNGRDLVAALSSGATALELSSDTFLQPSDLEGHELPFQVQNGTLTLRGAKYCKLDFGGLTRLLNIKAGAMLVLANLNISGLANPMEPPAGVDTAIESLHIWPSILGEPNAGVHFTNVNLTLFPSRHCTPGVVAGRIRQLQLFTGADNASVWGEGLIGHFVNFSIPLPIVNLTTKQQVGAMSFVGLGTNMTCTPDGSVPTEGRPRAWLPYAVASAGVLVAALVQYRWHQVQKQRSGTKAWEGGSDPSLLSSKGSLEASESMRDSLWRSRVGAIEGLHISGILGRGGYGAVYQGKWRGTQVAVKIVPTNVARDQRVDLGMEPLLSLSLSHPNIITSFKMCVVRLLSEAEAEQARTLLGGSSNNSSVVSTLTRATLPEGSSGGSAGGSAAGSNPTPPAGAAPTLPDGSAPTPPTGSGSGTPHGSSGRSSGGHPSLDSSKLSSSGGRRFVHSLTDSSHLVEIMSTKTVLEPGMYEVWLVSELADKGSLADAIDAGKFRSNNEPSGLDLPVVLLCLMDIARGLEYLGASNIVHGDLKAHNVLLKTARADRRGFVCKLADFGLARLLPDLQTHVDTGSYGTITHAAPELLTEGRLTRASDIYAFGMLGWELASGTRPFRNMSTMQVMFMVTQQNFRPPMPDGCHPRLAALIQRCWDKDPAARPDIAEVIEELAGIGRDMKQKVAQPQPPAQPQAQCSPSAQAQPAHVEPQPQLSLAPAAEAPFS